MIHGCTVGGHPVLPQSRPAPAPSITQRCQPPGDKGRRSHATTCMSPQAVSQQTGPALLIYSPWAGCHRTWRRLSSPLALANPVAMQPRRSPALGPHPAASMHREMAKQKGGCSTLAVAAASIRMHFTLLCSFLQARRELDQG